MAVEVVDAELVEDHIRVESEKSASIVYNKGYFGIPQPGGWLKLDLVEAVYLLDMGRIRVFSNGKRITLEKLIRYATSVQVSFEIKYLVYRDLRQRGYVVKPNADPLDFYVLPRGGVPNKNPSKYWVAAISERAFFHLNDLGEMLGRVLHVKKTLLLGVVDEESDLTYYRVKRSKPRGKAAHGNLDRKVSALLLEDRAMVLDENDAEYLHSTGFYGKVVGKGLQLSLIETAYLLEKGVLNVKNSRTGRSIRLQTFIKNACRIQPDFPLRFRVYKDLKEEGLIVKTGFKYGVHFRAYEGDAESTHARYLVHAVPEGYTSMWPEVSRAVRLAHGVKKVLLFGRNCEEGIDYIRLERVRP